MTNGVPTGLDHVAPINIAAISTYHSNKRNQTMTNTLLIDADMLLYRIMTACEIEVFPEPDVVCRWAPLDEVREQWGKKIDEMRELLQADYYHFCWTGSSAFRRRLLPEYKQNRAGKLKPMGWKPMKAELLQEDASLQHDEIEADDWLGILATNPEWVEGEAIIMSGDKDLDQIPGLHWWPWKENEDDMAWNVTPEEAVRQFYIQTLTGDSSDNIKGCPGVGPVKANKLVDTMDLSDEQDCWNIVRASYRAAYEKAGITDDPVEAALLNARLVRILREDNYNIQERKVTLWTPGWMQANTKSK